MIRFEVGRYYQSRAFPDKTMRVVRRTERDEEYNLDYPCIWFDVYCNGELDWRFPDRLFSHVFTRAGRECTDEYSAAMQADAAKHKDTMPHRTMYCYESTRYHTPSRQECADLSEAIKYAWGDMETGEAWPTRILEGDVVLWEQSGPAATGDALAAFAAANGVALAGAEIRR